MIRTRYFVHAVAAAMTVSLMAAAAAAAQVPGNGNDNNGTPVCLQAANFQAEGSYVLAAPATGEEYVVSDLRWAAHESCERFVIELGLGDDVPASVTGEVTAEFLRDLGLVRVHLHEAHGVELDEPTAAELEIDGELARQAYVVRHLDQLLYVDLHLAGEAEAAVFVLGDPGRVVVDLRPGGGPVPAPAATNDFTVLLTPRDGDSTSYPFTVRGYARHFEANVVVRFERAGEPVGDEFITSATDWVDAWGEFELTLDEGPVGRVHLHAGEYSAADGTWDGASVTLDIERRGVVPAIARTVEHPESVGMVGED